MITHTVHAAHMNFTHDPMDYPGVTTEPFVVTIPTADSPEYHCYYQESLEIVVAKLSEKMWLCGNLKDEH